MNIERGLFLALTLSLSTAACAASTDATGAANADMTERLPDSVCTVDGRDEPSPIAEGVCADLTDKAQRDDFARLTSITESGKPLFEVLGCVPSETGEFLAPLGQVDCPTDIAEIVFSTCHAYADLYQPTAAKEAVRCLRELKDLTQLAEVAICGIHALDKSCSDPADVEATCVQIENARIAAGDVLSDGDKHDCRVVVGGLRPEGRAELEKLCKRDDFLDLQDAIGRIGLVFDLDEPR